MVGASRVFHIVVKDENIHLWPNWKNKPFRHSFVRVFVAVIGGRGKQVVGTVGINLRTVVQSTGGSLV